MHVIWKRPDGFHDADPSDFEIVTLDNQAKLWLHKRDRDHYPFRIAGGWQESEATQRLNNLVNLLNRDDAAWADCLLKLFNDSMAADDGGRFLDDIVRWVADLKGHLKGDTWEVEIMGNVLSQVEKRLGAARSPFLRSATHA